MLTKEEFDNFNSLMSSFNIENIELALEIAKGNDIEINSLAINQIYQYLTGVNDETLSKSSLSKKIVALNSWSKLNLTIENDQFNYLWLSYLKNIKELNLKFKCRQIQYISSFMKKVYLLPSLEKLSLRYYPISFLELSISQLSKLRELDLEGSRIKELPYSNLKNLKKICLKFTPLMEMKSDIEKLLPNCELITN